MKITNVFKKIIELIEKLIQIFLICFTSIVFINVIGRYFFSYTFMWAEQIARYMFIFMSFLGVILVTYHEEHLAVDIIVSRLNSRIRKVIILIGMLISIIVMLYIGISGIKILSSIREYFEPPLLIRLDYIYLIIPIFAFLTLGILLKQFLELILGYTELKK